MAVTGMPAKPVVVTRTAGTLLFAGASELIVSILPAVFILLSITSASALRAIDSPPVSSPLYLSIQHSASADYLRLGQALATERGGTKPNPHSLAFTHGTSAQPNIESRQFHFWNIPETPIPFGALVLYRLAAAWERYDTSIAAGLFLIVAQLLLILGLLRQRNRKRTTEASLRESENRFRSMADIAPALIWMCDKDGNVFYHNSTHLNFTGSKPGVVPGDNWIDYVHPADLRNVLDANARSLERPASFSKEYRLLRRDGVYRWMMDVAAPRRNGDGSFAGFIGSASDITDQKTAQEALHKMSGKLIEAQEKERSRIARELHDDICQRLALLSLELEQTSAGTLMSGAALGARMSEIRQHCTEIAGDLQALSHELHSSKLEYLGVVTALISFCREFSQQTGVQVAFTQHDFPATLPSDISLCLFRVVQEALHNAVKHSGACRFTVVLRGLTDGVELEVSDAGTGFDVQKAMQNGGLGLVSMQERVHLLNGTFFIWSKVNEGSRIVATIPVVTDMSASATASASI
jgi:PAS domain S-box-containing protein